MSNKREPVVIGPQVGILDLESLDIFDDAILLSGGLVVADITKRIPFEKLVSGEYSTFFKLASAEQKGMGRALSAQCVKEFWMSDKVDERARQTSFFPDPVRDMSVTELPDLIDAQLKRLGGEDIHWLDRNAFDFSKMNHLYDRTLDLGSDRCPFKPHNTWEISTVLQHLGQDRYAGIGPWHFKHRGFIYHHPVHDSALDWLRYQFALESVGLITVTDL